MINNSLWLKGIKTTKCPTLKNNISTDILIIGGGITGITTAFYLKDEKKDITIIDANKVGLGKSSRTTGKLTYFQGDNLNKIGTTYNSQIVSKYIDSQKYAIDLVKNNIITHGIKCNLESNSSFIFTNNDSDIDKIKNIETFLKKNNINYKLSKDLPIKYPSKYAIKVFDTAVFHPVKYILALKDICISKGVHIYENTKAIDLEKESDGYLVKTNKSVIKAKKVVLACHYPFFIIPGLFPFKTYIEKSYIASGLTNKNKMFNAISIDGNDSIRYHSDNKDYIIYCSISNSLGLNMDNKTNYDKLLWNVKTNITPDVKYYWFNTDIMTPDGLPLIGYYEKDNKYLLIGTGFNTWGMTNGTLAGKVLSDLIKNKKNKYSKLVDPNRPLTISKSLNIISSNVDNGISFISSKLKNNYDFYPKNVKVVVKNGTKYGIYTDDMGTEHIVNATCPHMKCSLIFNDIDKTWDCPCHSSRFDIDGKVISGPSVYDISVK